MAQKVYEGLGATLGWVYLVFHGIGDSKKNTEYLQTAL